MLFAPVLKGHATLIEVQTEWSYLDLLRYTIAVDLEGEAAAYRLELDQAIARSRLG